MDRIAVQMATQSSLLGKNVTTLVPLTPLSRQLRLEVILVSQHCRGRVRFVHAALRDKSFAKCDSRSVLEGAQIAFLALGVLLKLVHLRRQGSQVALGTLSLCCLSTALTALAGHRLRIRFDVQTVHSSATGLSGLPGNLHRATKLFKSCPFFSQPLQSLLEFGHNVKDGSGKSNFIPERFITLKSRGYGNSCQRRSETASKRDSLI